MAATEAAPPTRAPLQQKANGVAVAVGKIGYDARVSVVDHLDELRTRLTVCLPAVAVASACAHGALSRRAART